MKTYRVTIERTEITIVDVEADDEHQAQILAWQKWHPDNYGLADSNVTNVEEVV